MYLIYVHISLAPSRRGGEFTRYRVSDTRRRDATARGGFIPYFNTIGIIQRAIFDVFLMASNI